MIDGSKDVSRKYWDKDRIVRKQWWNYPEIHSAISNAYFGVPVRSADSYIINRLRGRVIRNAISVGCGYAFHERLMVMQGVVDQFHCVDLSDVRLSRAFNDARNSDVSKRMKFTQSGSLDFEPEERKYDLVFWHQALHHQSDVRKAIEWSSRVLSDGGIFVMHEYVGPNFLQWTDANVSEGQRIRNLLSELCHETFGALQNVSLDKMRSVDPFEACDSENILPSLHSVFENVDACNIGGLFYFVSLKGISERVIPALSKEQIRMLLEIDRFASLAGHVFFSIAFAENK